MKLQGLKFVGLREVPQTLNGDLVHSTDTFAIGGGEWSIEVYDFDGHCIKEFVGLNGTRDDEEATDLWAEYSEWCKEVAKPAYTYKEFEAPDGERGSKSFFYREAYKGKLHGLIAVFKQTW